MARRVKKYRRTINRGRGVTSRKPGPTKPEYPELGMLTQLNFNFLQELWGSRGDALRNSLWEKAESDDEPGLRALLLKKWKVKVPTGLRLMLVDVKGARSHSFVGNVRTEQFYVLVLPPRPTRDPRNKNYNDQQCWNSAHYHAVNDSYGM
jgi:hypothetical protein